MKNIEKVLSISAVFLFSATWIMLVYSFATNNIMLLSQQAQIYGTDSISSTNVITAPPALLQSTTSTINTTSEPATTSTSGGTGGVITAPPALLQSTTSTIDTTSKSATTSTSGDSGITSVSRPLGAFIYPSSNNSISSKVEIKFQIADTTSVEFYLKRPESSTELYLGYSFFSSDNTWIYYWDSASTPNGNYYLTPYITNKYGRYAGSSVYISVNNQTALPAEQITQLRQEITNTENTIQTQEQQLNQIQTNLNDSVSQRTSEISSAANNILSPEKSLQVTKELNDISEQIKSTAGATVQDLSKISQELNAKAGQVSSIISASEDKAEVEELQKEVGAFVTDSVGLLNNYLSEKQKLEQTENALALKDSDNDGLPDNEEIRLGTNPFGTDTDGDGFLDGSEVKLGYDPLAASPADKITYQNPKEVQAPASTAYEVNKVELIESPQDKSAKVLKIGGKAPANSFVTIYIYSTPTIVVTKADENGNWEYTLDKPLSDGRHTVYASVTNNKGDIEAVSKSFDFVKAEDKIVKLLSPAEGTTESPSQKLNRIFVIMLLITVLLAVVFVVIVLGIYLKQHSN